MNSIAQIRQQFPQYNDLDDDALLQGLHRRFYSDMPFDQFRTRLSERPEQQQPTRTAESVGRNWLERNITDPVERGYQGVAMGVNELRGANPDSFFGQSPEEAAASIARRQRRLEEIPRTEESQAAMRRAAEADGIVGAVGQIARSGDAVTDIVTESIGANPVAGGVGLLANVTPVPVLRQILGGLAGALGFPTEFLSSRGQALMQAAQAAGVDPRDPQALAGLIREINADPERRAEIRNDALTRAGIIAGVDAAAGYGAGRLATRSAVPRIAGAAGIEGVGGGVGEAAAQLATTGELDQTEIAAEIVGGSAMGAAGNITRAVDPALAARSQREAEDEELARALRERAETEEPERPILQLGTDIPRRIETPYGAMTPNQLMEFAEANVEAFPALRGVMAMPAGETAGLGGGETGRFTEGERIRLIADILNDQPNAVGDARARGESEDARAALAEISRLEQQIANTTNPARLDQLTAARSEAVNRLGEITQRDSDIAPRDESAETRRVLIGLEPEDRALIERFFPNPSTFALQRPEVQAQFLEVARQRANRESNATRQIRDEIAGFDRQIARTKQPILLARLREARADAVRRLGDVAQREVEGFQAFVDQAPRMAADADRQIAEIAERIGEDPVALVTSTLPVTETDFRRAIPDARERLVARAQQLRTAQTPGRPLRTSFDASQSEGEASPPSRPNAPAFASKARGQFEDTTRASSPTATEIEAQGTPTTAQIRQANETQDRSDQQGRLLDQLRGERARTLDAKGRLTELRRAEAAGTITPREQQELARLEEGLQTIEARINAAMLRADDLSRRAGFGSQSASGTSDRLFPDFEEGRDGEATPGFGPDPRPGETQAQYLERQARERAQRERDAIRDRILREQEARARAREEAARDKADADRANAKQRENTKSPGKPDANGFYSVDEDGFLINGEKLVVFSSKRTAANWMVPNRQAAYWDFVIRAANSEEVMLRAKPAYYADKREAEADARAEQPGQSETPRSIGGPQFSALNTDQQPAAEAAPEATPEADRAERRARANAIIDARLERLKAMGKQGRLARNAVVAALKDRRFTPEQMLAAFRIAEAFTRVVGGGKAVRLEFRQNLDDMRDQAGGAEPQALIEAIKAGPNGVEAVARFSLSDSNLPVANMTAPHEAFHVLQALFKGSEPKLAQILDRAFPAGKGLDGIDPTILRKLKTLRPAGANRSYYDFLKAAVPNEQRPAELQAYVFGAMMDAQMRGEPMAGMTPAIIRMVNYFAQMKRQVGALMRGDGVTAAGIMERAGRGEYGRLERAQDTTSAQASALKPPQDTTKEEEQVRGVAEYFRNRAATSRARGNEDDAVREEALAAREEQRANDLKSARENRTPEIPPLPASVLRKADQFYARGGDPYAPLQPLLADMNISDKQYERIASEIYGGEPGSWPNDRRIQRAREAGDEDKVQRAYRITGAQWLQQYLANRMNADVLERAKQLAQQESGDPDRYVGYLSRARAQVESMHQARPATPPGREARSIPSLVSGITTAMNDLTNSILSEDMRTQKEEGVVSLDLARRMKDRGVQFSAMDPAALRQFSAATMDEKVKGVAIDRPNFWTSSLRKFMGAKETEIYGGGRRIERLSDAFVRNAVNRAHPFYLLGKLLERQGNLSHRNIGEIVESSLNNAGRIEAMVMFGPPTYDPKTGEIGVKADVPGLYDIYNGRIRESEQNEAQVYFVALRERDLRKAGRKGFFNLTDAEIAKRIRDAEAAHPQWKEAAELQQKFNKALLDFSVATGTVTRQTADKLGQLFYTPFYRQMEEDGQRNPEEVIGPRATDTLNNPRPWTELKGGDKPIGDLFENTLRNADAIVRAGVKNAAMGQAAKAMEAAKLAKRVKPSEKQAGTITLRENGQPIHYQVDDPVLYAGIAGLPAQSRNAVVDIMARIGGFFRDMITADPGFIIANLWRGKVVAYVQEGASLNPATTIDGLKQALQGSTALQRIMMQTGFGGFDFGMDPRDASGNFAQRLKRAERGQTVGGKLRNMGDIRAIIGALQRVSEATEMAERVKLYERLVAQGMDEKQAAFQAYRLAPFSRRGVGDGVAGQIVNFFVPIVPFLNAKIQSLYRLVENEKGDKRSIWTAGLPQQIFLRGLLLTAFSSALFALNADDERWDEETFDRKLAYDIIYVGDKTFYLPRAFEFGTIFSAIPTFLLDAYRREDGADLAKLVASVGTSTFFFNPIPAAVQPLITVAFNYDLFRGRELETKGQQALPSEDRVNPGTTTAGKLLSGAVNNTLGQLPEGLRVQLSPIQGQALLDGHLGSLGTTMMTGLDGLFGMLGWIPNKPAGALGDPNSPLGIAATLSRVGRFVKDDQERVTRFVGDFYRIKERVDQLNRSMSDARAAGDIERITEIMEDGGGALAAQKPMSQIGRRLGEINRQMRLIERQGGDPEEMRDRLAILREQRNMLARQGVEMARALGL